MMKARVEVITSVPRRRGCGSAALWMLRRSRL
jgi:hypothetical protein